MSTTTHRSLLQVVPGLPPAVDGIGDHALQLARQLQRRHGLKTSFIVCDPGWRREGWHHEFAAVGLNERSSNAMQEAVHLLGGSVNGTGMPLLLHFSPYGYARRGVPLWLVRALETLHLQGVAAVHTALHELDAQGAQPWRSAFWVTALQQSIIRRLLRLSRFAYTNTEAHGARLERWCAQRLPVIPNFSNMGETDEPPLAPRAREVVVFGRADQRRWSYRRGAAALKTVCRHVGAKRIVDIGPPIPEHTCAEIGGIPVVRRGVLPAEQLASSMRSALASFMYYPVALLTKSGVHALACASGTLPFVFEETRSVSAGSGLTEGVDFIAVRPDLPLPPMRVLEQLSPAIYASYCKRSSRVAAAVIASNLHRETPAL